MPLSTKWNMTDNIYYRQSVFVKECPVGVCEHVFNFSLKNTKRETYLYNNRMFFMFSKPTQEQKDQYDRNWQYINTL